MSTRRRLPSVAVPLAILVSLGLAACSSDAGDTGSSDTTGGASSETGSTESGVEPAPADTTAASGATPVEITTGPIAGALRISCGPVSDSQAEPAAALLRMRTERIDGAEVGLSAGAPRMVELALPDSVSDADAAALCGLPRVEGRPVLQEIPGTPEPGATSPALAAGDSGVFLDDEASAMYELGPVLVDATLFNPGAAADEVQGTGWMVTTTLTADGTAVWTTALDACFGRTPSCPTGKLAWLVDDRVVATGQVAAPYADTPTFVLPGTFSATTAQLLAGLIDLAAEGSFGPING